MSGIGSHNHYPTIDKKPRGHRRSLSSSSSSSSTTSSTTSSSSSSSSDSSPRRIGSSGGGVSGRGLSSGGGAGGGAGAGAGAGAVPGGSSSHKRDGKHKSRPSKRVSSSSNDRSKLKMKKTSSSSRKHSSSKSSRKTSHSRNKDYDKRTRKSSGRSPLYRKSTSGSKKQSGSSSSSHKFSSSTGLGSSGLGGSSSRKSRKTSPGGSKRTRKRSITPRDRMDYRPDRINIPEQRSLSHSRDASLASTSSSRLRDPRTDDRMRRISPGEIIPRDRYRIDSPTRRYEKDRIEDFVDWKEKRPSEAARPREVERKDAHRHTRDYDNKHEREQHYEDRRGLREEQQPQPQQQQQPPQTRRDDKGDRETRGDRGEVVREREVLREREIIKERDRSLLMDRDPQQERERDRIREVDERRGRYNRADPDYPRDREVVMKGVHEFESPPEREFFPQRGRPEGEGRGNSEDRRQYEELAYERFPISVSGERERGGRYESSGRGRYEEVPSHERRSSGGASVGALPGFPPPEDQRRGDERNRGRPLPPPTGPVDSRVHPEERRRTSVNADPRSSHHEGWVEERRGSTGSGSGGGGGGGNIGGSNSSVSGGGPMERLPPDHPDHPHHYPPPIHHPHHHQPPPASMHRRHHTGGGGGEWGGPPTPTNTSRMPPPPPWDRHKHPRHEEWSEDYIDGGPGEGEWTEEEHDWEEKAKPSRPFPPPPLPHSHVHDDHWVPHGRRGYRDDWMGGNGRGDWGPHERNVGGGPPGAPPPMLAPHPRPPPPGRDMVTHSPGARRGRRSDEMSTIRHRYTGDEDGNDHDQHEGVSPRPDGNVSDTSAFILDELSRSRLVSADNLDTSVPPPKRPRMDAPPPPAGFPPTNVPPPPITKAAKAAAAMCSHDGKDKDNFSDFSDDPDDILNQESLQAAMADDDATPTSGNNCTVAPPVAIFNTSVPPPSLGLTAGIAGTSVNLSLAATNDEAKNQPCDKELTYDELLDEEEGMDLEEISDDELEEEKQAKFSVANVLDIDWTSLMDAKPTLITEVAAGTALKRFRSGNLLSRLGISAKYARPDIIQKVVEKCNETALLDGQDENEMPKICPVVEPCGVVRILRSRADSRRQLIQSVGPNRRALCARQDLALRRLYCNLPGQDILGDDVYFDKDIFRQAAGLLTSC